MTSDTTRLIELIEDFRSELASELPVRLHTSTPTPASRDGDETFGHMTGLPFTASFMRYLGPAIEHGYEFIASDSFGEIRDHCRRNHDVAHLEPQPSGSLCLRLAVAVVELRQPLTFVAAQENIGIHAVRKHLLDVLAHAADWRANRRERAAARDMTAAVPAQPIDAMLRREHDEAIEQKVWDRLRVRYPTLPEWTVEQARRLEQHRKLGCVRCVGVAA